MTDDLSTQSCTPCRGGIPPLTQAEAERYRARVPDWTLVDGGAPGEGVLSASGNVLHHSYYFYLWRRGPYVIAPAFERGVALDRLTGRGPQTPVILQRAHYEQIRTALPEAVTVAGYDHDITALFPARYARCADAVIAAQRR